MKLTIVGVLAVLSGIVLSILIIRFLRDQSQEH